MGRQLSLAKNGHKRLEENAADRRTFFIFCFVHEPIPEE